MMGRGCSVERALESVLSPFSEFFIGLGNFVLVLFSSIFLAYNPF